MMIGLFTKQYQNIKIILDMLKSRGLVENSDLPAFEMSVRLDAQSNDALLRQATMEYLKAAKAAGVEVDLVPPKS